MWPAIIAAGASLAGGVMNSFGQASANSKAEDLANNNAALQREFATTGVTWKARDAMRAYGETGIHPLALLGVQGASYSPVSAQYTPESGIGDGLARAGSDFSRAYAAGQDRDLREKALAIQEKQLESMSTRMDLENEALRLRIASEKARLSQMSMPGVPGMKSEQSIMFPGVEGKVIPDVTVTRTPRGGYVVLPSEAAQQRMSEMFGLSSEWFTRNRAWLATPEARDWVRQFLPAPGYGREWVYNAPTGEWLQGHKEFQDRHLPRKLSPGRDVFSAPLW